MSSGVNGVCFSFMIRKADRCITSFFNSHLRKYGLLVTQFSLLMELAEGERGHISGLAKKLMMDRTTLMRNLSIMEKKDYVKTYLEFSGKNGKKKKRMIGITATGLLKATEAIKGWEEAHSEVKKAFTEPEIQKFREYLFNLYEKLIVGVEKIIA